MSISSGRNVSVAAATIPIQQAAQMNRAIIGRIPAGAPGPYALAS